MNTDLENHNSTNHSTLNIDLENHNLTNHSTQISYRSRFSKSDPISSRTQKQIQMRRTQKLISQIRSHFRQELHIRSLQIILSFSQRHIIPKSIITVLKLVHCLLRQTRFIFSLLLCILSLLRKFINKLSSLKRLEI